MKSQRPTTPSVNLNEARAVILACKCLDMYAGEPNQPKLGGWGGNNQEFKEEILRDFRYFDNSELVHLKF